MVEELSYFAWEIIIFQIVRTRSEFEISLVVKNSSFPEKIRLIFNGDSVFLNIVVFSLSVRIKHIIENVSASWERNNVSDECWQILWALVQVVGVHQIRVVIPIKVIFIVAQLLNGLDH